MGIYPELIPFYDAHFPNLKSSDHEKTSLKDGRYNCIAYALHDTKHNWWPVTDTQCFWPKGLAKEVSISAFAKAFRKGGFERCESGSLEAGFEKIALYCLNGKPTHAARQLIEGKFQGHWTSKLGRNIDIRHATLEALNGPQYGVVRAFFRRPLHKPSANSSGNKPTINSNPR